MSKFNAWFNKQAPTRDSFERSRFLRPFAQRVFHPALWRFTRRSVPRGVALGLLVGIFLLVPGVQIAGVALLALPFRANIPIGVYCSVFADVYICTVNQNCHFSSIELIVPC
jgi:uncharacterized protein (DUF2062 family)